MNQRFGVEIDIADEESRNKYPQFWIRALQEKDLLSVQLYLEFLLSVKQWGRRDNEEATRKGANGGNIGHREEDRKVANGGGGQRVEKKLLQKLGQQMKERDNI